MTRHRFNCLSLVSLATVLATVLCLPLTSIAQVEIDVSQETESRRSGPSFAGANAEGDIDFEGEKVKFDGAANFHGWYPHAILPPFYGPTYRHQDASDVIYPGNARFQIDAEPRIPEPLRRPFLIGGEFVAGYWMVHFDQGVTPQLQQRLDELTGEVRGPDGRRLARWYIPNRTHIAWVQDAKTLAALQGWPEVAAVLPYHPAYKISQWIGSFELTTPERVGRERYLLNVDLIPGHPAAEVKKTLAAQGIEVIDEIYLPGLKTYDVHYLIVQVSRQQLLDVVLVEGVRMIQETGDGLRKFDISAGGKIQARTLAADDAANSPIVNATTFPLWLTHNLQGQGQMVGIVDTGLDWNNTGTVGCAFGVPDLLIDNFGYADPVNATLLLPAIGAGGVSLKVPRSDELGGATLLGTAVTEHGTAVAGAAVADFYGNDATKFWEHDVDFWEPWAPQNFSGLLGPGIAHEAQLYFTPLMNDADVFQWELPGEFPANMAETLTNMANAGVCTTNHSVGLAEPANSYSQTTVVHDTRGFDHPGMLQCFPGGNAGAVANAMTSQSVMKNGLTVGGSDDVLLPEDRLAFSSTGPRFDGALKPEVMAPGSDTFPRDGGVASALILPNSNGAGAGSCAYTFIQGTSFSSPVIAGAGALIHQYFEEGRYAGPNPVTDPSAAMMRGMLINGGHRLTGANLGDNTYPNNHQGWGEPNLSNVLDFGSGPRGLYVEDIAAAGGFVNAASPAHNYTVNVTSAAEALKITLSWTDEPGTVGTGKKLINDLHLRVTSPTGVVFLGNVINGVAGESQSGGLADTLNTTESVIRINPEVGAWQINVDPFEGNFSVNQGYALVVSGAITVDAPDCDGNGIPDETDIASGATDCNGNGVPDVCEPDCNGNNIADGCDLAAGTSLDCNVNGTPDSCDIIAGTSADCDGNGVPDECQLLAGATDCNGNGQLDSCDLDLGLSTDCDLNGVLDECDLVTGGIDCDANNILDVCDLAAGSADCNGNGIPDSCDLLAIPGGPIWANGSETLAGAVTIGAGTHGVNTLGATTDGLPLDPLVCDPGTFGDDQLYNDVWYRFTAPGNGEVEFSTCNLVDYDSRIAIYLGASGAPVNAVACNDDGLNCTIFSSLVSFQATANQLYTVRVGGFSPADRGTGVMTMTWLSSDAQPLSTDANGNGIPDECEAPDCNNNGIPDDQDIADGTAADCDGNSIPDSCQNDLDTDSDGLIDPCDPDDDNDGVVDAEDGAPLNPNACRDVDLDGCDDCSGGFDNPAADGVDTDSDGLCNLGDPDDDNDGVLDGDDNAPLDPTACRDADVDGCDDCSSGVDNPATDGADHDGDGLCDLGDPDDDNDGVVDGQDSAPFDNTVCRDVDNDGCDDCSSGTDDPANDGPDGNGDGICDVPGGDADGDGVPDAEDSSPFDPNLCRDIDGDGCDDCASGTDNPAADGTDTDGDGLCDLGDPDDDNDGVVDPQDSAPLNPNFCRDLDADGCDDCSSGVDSPGNDGTDTDGDGLCDLGDPDDDNDGVVDSQDSAPLNPNFCRDLDADGCDDCSSGSDNPASDGTDTDGDGLCDLGDPDDDNDGVVDSQDSAPLDNTICRDVDGDGCDDCSSGSDNPASDGTDTDGDGLCDLGDPDDDNDGVEDGQDSAPLDPNLCRDTDNDGCDDCSSGVDAPADDGTDTDGDGLCDIGDPDDDNDGVVDGQDSAPLNPNFCRDVDNDGCDDCSSGVDAPDNDGTDTDSDGLCDLGDPDDDNDGVVDGQDSAPLNPNFCRDADSDGCDDCSSGVDAPDNDGTDTDSDGLCDLGDPDDDNDGVVDGDDAAPLDSSICRDVDADGCDDCSSGIDDPANDGTDTDSDGLCDLGDPDDDGDGVLDDCDIDSNTGSDCNSNGVIDSCEIADGTATDSDGNGVPDSCEATPFRRGDVNGDALFNIADPVSALAFLFTGGSISCDDAADCNDDGTVNIADAVSALAALFSGADPPPAPGPDSCGPDPTDDTLECDSYNSC
ncbi:MAG: S8 family serine peptidase [Planctomycetota bacterium]|nr:S8 family serine peptidase [Planctomycetota bacterium]